MSSNEQPHSLHHLSEAIVSLDAAIASALGAAAPFADHPAYREVPEHGALRFMFIVTTLYTLYREAGGEDLKFLNRKIAPSQGQIIRHYHLVHDLRTFAQHEVKSDSKKVKLRRDQCQDWFNQTIDLQGNNAPFGEDAWNKCIENLLSEAVTYLCALKAFVEGLHDGMGEYVKKEWLLFRTRYVPHGEFDQIAWEIAGDLGMGSRDIVAFRTQHHEGIVRDLRAQRFDVDVHSFLRQAITARLLEEFPGVILVAEDLKALGMKPGPELGKALKEGQRIWVDSNCLLKKEQVVERLRELSYIN